jgi:hypothetical protein
MMKKKNSLLIITVIFSGLFISCLDNFTERAYYSANVKAFSFAAQDTCPNIQDYVFNIDQLTDTGQIYNLDSLPYGRKTDHLLPSLTLETTDGNIYMNDSIWGDKAAHDTISFKYPVLLKNTSSDGLYTRYYRIHVNVHQVDPDSMILHKQSNVFPTDAPMNKMLLSNENDKESFRNYFALSAGGMSAHSSNDGGLSWTSQTITGITENVNLSSLCKYNSMYYIVSKAGQLYRSQDGLSWDIVKDASNNVIKTNLITLFGQIKRKYITEKDSIYLIGLADSSGIIYPVRSVDGINWTYGSSAVSSEFPISEGASIKGTTVTGVEFYTVATGLKADGRFCTSVWSTENGLDWYSIHDYNDITKPPVQRKGASLFYYNDTLVCFGGIDSLGLYYKDFHVSADWGLGWAVAPASWNFSNSIMHTGLAYSSVYVEQKAGPLYNNKNNKDREFIWIFGGSSSMGNVSPDIWKAYLNKMVFARW